MPVKSICLGLVLLFAVLLLPLAPVVVYAQEAGVHAPGKAVVIDKRKLLVQPRNADGTILQTPFTQDPVLWMRTKQQNFYGRMSLAIRQLKSTSAMHAAWTLVSISFLYGAFHAAGPGHGKAVVTGWVLATENELKRGILIAFLSALIQALTAIVVVAALVLMVQGAATMARDIARFLESASYAMIVGMGLYLVWNGWRSFRPVIKTAAEKGPFEIVSRPLHGVDHVHDANCGCGHAHVPAAAQLRGDWSWKRAFSMAFAVGIRPCSGAILVLITSYALGLFWAGVLSTLAMGFGVFLTIATIASVAVFAKSKALQFAGHENQWTKHTVRWGKIVVGALISGLGGLLFFSSLSGGAMVM